MLQEDAELGSRLVELRGYIDDLELQFAELAAEFEKSKHWEHQGSNSAIDWIRFHCHMTSNAAADRVAVGERIAEMPESRLAMQNGDIGFAHLTVMARTTNAVGDAFEGRPQLDRDLARPDRGTRGRGRVLAPHRLEDGGALGLRLQPDPNPAPGLGRGRRQSSRADHPRTPAAGIDRPRPPLPVARLRAAGLLVRRTSHRLLGPRRRRRSGEPVLALAPVITGRCTKADGGS